MTPAQFILLKWQGKKWPIIDLKEYNNSTPSVLLAAPRIPLKQQTSGHSWQEG